MKRYALAVALALFATTATANRYNFEGTAGNDFVEPNFPDYGMSDDEYKAYVEQTKSFYPHIETWRDWGTWDDEVMDSGVEAMLGKGSDRFTGTPVDDGIFGGSGDDVIAGAEGNDYIHGGNGSDVLDGGFGNDILIGGRGYDYLYPGAGKDIMIGGPGIDTYYIGWEDVYDGDWDAIDFNTVILESRKALNIDRFLTSWDGGNQGSSHPITAFVLGSGEYAEFTSADTSIKKVSIQDIPMPSISAAGRNLTLHRSGFRDEAYKMTNRDSYDPQDNWHQGSVTHIIIQKKK